MLKILANDGMDKSGVEELKSLGHHVDTNHYDGDELVEQLKDTDVIVIRSATKIRTPLIDSLVNTNSKLKLIIRAGVGIDNIDHEYAKSKGFEVRNTPNSSSAAVAELVLGHMFSLARFIGISNVTMRSGEWLKNKYKGIELSGKTLGIVGMGRIARELAIRANALGMTIIYNNRSGELADCSYKFVQLDELLKQSDFVSLHIPFDKTKGAIIGEKEFALMKEGSYLLNAARGGVVCEKSLLAALNSGKLAGAAIDVFEEEPTKNMELINHSNVSVTPHIGASTKEAQFRIATETIDVIKQFFA